MNHHPVSWEIIHIQRGGLLIAGIPLLVLFYLFVPLALVQFMCLFLLFILLGSRFYSEYLARKIRISRRDKELRVFRYEWVQVELRAENHGVLPAFMLILGDAPGKLSVFKNRKTLCTILPRSWIPFVWQGYCAERGAFTLGPAAVRGADPLGLFPFQLSAGERSRLFVYPAFRSIQHKASGGIPLGNMSASNPLFEDITRCRSLRPYQSGDELRRINWKVSARMSHTNSFMVNEYEATSFHPLMIFLNLNRNDYPVKNQKAFIERSIEAAAALCLKAAREQQYLGIIIYLPGKNVLGEEDGISVIAPAAFTLIPILERLAALDWARTGAEENTSTEAQALEQGSARVMLDQGKYLPYGTLFFYTGPDLGDEAYMALNSLKRHHLYLEYLVIDEQTMPPLVPGNSPRHQMQERGYEIIE